MLLSNIPFNLLCTTENWITSVKGKPGKIIAINTQHDGKHFKTHLTIEWNDGSLSYPSFPDECDNLIVNAPEAVYCRDWVDYQQSKLRIHQAYIGCLVVPGT